MKLPRIYASKLYLTSSRKQEIDAAINSSDNVELVQQLSEYLDSDARDKLDEAIQEKEDEQAAQEAENTPEPTLDDNFGEEVPDEKNVFSPSYSGAGGGIPSGPSDFGEDMGGEGSDIFDMPEGDEGEPAPAPEPDAAVEESTAIYGEVTADTKLETNINKLAEEADIIKGTLNANDSTAGIIRLVIDNDELWLYYKDEVNIGDIMVDVIEILNASAYTYLTFSRLARSNNAIVFDINEVVEPVKPTQKVEEEVK